MAPTRLEGRGVPRARDFRDWNASSPANCTRNHAAARGSYDSCIFSGERLDRKTIMDLLWSRGSSHCSCVVVMYTSVAENYKNDDSC